MSDITQNHYALLMIEYGAAFVQLDKIAERYLSLSQSRAARDASLHRLPFPAFRAGTQKSPWVVSVLDLAAYLDKKHAEAVAEWNKMNSTA